MQKVFDNPAKLEALAKQKYGFPDFIMMENAALAIKNLLLELKNSAAECLILCGKGNNGGDGYALARLIMQDFTPLVFSLEQPTAKEAIVQYQMCQKLGVKFLTQKQLNVFFKQASNTQNPTQTFIVDCLYGTGFKGELPSQVSKIIKAANNTNAIKIACDIPTALSFNAHYTVTMGEQKLALFSDKAKQACGKIIVADLGITKELFENQELLPAAFLIEDQDCKLPLRTNKAAHKGTYGHTAVFAGNKSGAAIICATAAMDFGSGLTTIIKQEKSNLAQFKISPELMISREIPSKTTCIVLGPGSENLQPQTAQAIEQWWFNKNNKTPAAVFDAGMFGDLNFVTLLHKLNTKKDSRIILTPHLAELVRFCSLQPDNFTFKNITIKELAENPQTKIEVGKAICKIFPNTTIVIKSANTFICTQQSVFIVTDGSPSLAKGGSGDVLAGMLASLLAQGYSTKDAAITACQIHAKASKIHGPNSYDLSPNKILKIISKIN